MELKYSKSTMLVGLILILSSFLVKAQQALAPEDESYRIPFNKTGSSIKHRLSGTFGEPRSNATRVHAGTDLGSKGLFSNEMVGEKVYYLIDNRLENVIIDNSNSTINFIFESAKIHEPGSAGRGLGGKMTFGQRVTKYHLDKMYRYFHVKPAFYITEFYNSFSKSTRLLVVDVKAVNKELERLDPDNNFGRFSEHDITIVPDPQNGGFWYAWPLRMEVGNIADVDNNIINEHLHFEDRKRDALSPSGGFGNQIQDAMPPTIHSLSFYEDGAETLTDPQPFTSGDGSRQNPVETFGKTAIDVLADIVDHANGNTANKFMPKFTSLKTRCVATNQLVDQKQMELSHFEQHFGNEPNRTGPRFLYGPGTQIGGSGTKYKIWTSNKWSAANGGSNSRINGLEPGGLYQVRLALTDHYGNSVADTVYLSTGRIISNIPDFENKSCFHPDGIIIEDELTVKDVGTEFIIPEDRTLKLKANARLIIKSGGTFRLKPGARVEMGKDAEIIIEEGAHIESNFASFTSLDPLDSSRRYDRVLIKSDNNTIKYTTFEGGTYNVWVTGDGNRFESTNFRNGYYGLRTSGADDLVLEGVNIKKNSSRGLYSWSSDIEIRERNKQLSDRAESVLPAIISQNGDEGIYLAGSSTLYMHGSASKSNGGSEIYIRENARLFAGKQQSDINQGHNRISDEGGFYIYSLARTFDGETFRNWRVPAEFNYWGTSSAPSSSRFFGNVNRNNHLDYDPAVQKNIYNDDCLQLPCGLPDDGTITSTPKEHLTMGMARAVTAGVEDPYKKRRLVESKMRLIEINEQIKKKPFHLHNAQYLKEAVYLIRYLQETDAGVERRQMDKKLRQWSRRYVNMIDRGNAPVATSLEATEFRDDNGRRNDKKDKKMDRMRARMYMGEAAMLMEIENAIFDQNYEQARDYIERFTSYVQNKDSYASLLVLEALYFEKTGQFGQAFATLEQVEQISAEHRMQAQFRGAEFKAHKQVLQDSMKANDQIAQKVASDSLSTPEDTSQQAQTSDLPQSVELSPAFPNPFNPSTQLPFALPEAAEIRVEVYSITGRLVAVLANGRFDAGRHTLAFNAAGLASGVYLVRARLGEKIQTRKITLVK